MGLHATTQKGSLVLLMVRVLFNILPAGLCIYSLCLWEWVRLTSPMHSGPQTLSLNEAAAMAYHSGATSMLYFFVGAVASFALGAVLCAAGHPFKGALLNLITALSMSSDSILKPMPGVNLWFLKGYDWMWISIGAMVIGSIAQKLCGLVAARGAKRAPGAQQQQPAKEAKEAKEAKGAKQE
jgi:hypothetical protein